MQRDLVEEFAKQLGRKGDPERDLCESMANLFLDILERAERACGPSSSFLTEPSHRSSGSGAVKDIRAANVTLVLSSMHHRDEKVVEAFFRGRKSLEDAGREEGGARVADKNICKKVAALCIRDGLVDAANMIRKLHRHVR